MLIFKSVKVFDIKYLYFLQTYLDLKDSVFHALFKKVKFKYITNLILYRFKSWFCKKQQPKYFKEESYLKNNNCQNIHKVARHRFMFQNTLPFYFRLFNICIIHF